VQHALSVRQAIQRENYHEFFILFQDVPNMGGCILNPMLDSARLNALRGMVRAYKPNLPVSFVATVLGFASTSEGNVFLKRAGCCFLYDSSGTATTNSSKKKAEVDDAVSESILIDTQKTTIDASAVLTQDKLLL
jgi:hypothetical protein